MWTVVICMGLGASALLAQEAVYRSSQHHGYEGLSLSWAAGWEEEPCSFPGGPKHNTEGRRWDGSEGSILAFCQPSEMFLKVFFSLSNTSSSGFPSTLEELVPPYYNSKHPLPLHTHAQIHTCTLVSTHSYQKVLSTQVFLGGPSQSHITSTQTFQLYCGFPEESWHSQQIFHLQKKEGN